MGDCDNRLRQQQAVYQCNMQLACTPTAKNNLNAMSNRNTRVERIAFFPLDVLNNIPGLLCVGEHNLEHKAENKTLCLEKATFPSLIRLLKSGVRSRIDDLGRFLHSNNS
jgi:hypothetical protein